MRMGQVSTFSCLGNDFLLTCQFADLPIRGQDISQKCNVQTGRFAEKRFADQQDYSWTNSNIMTYLCHSISGSNFCISRMIWHVDSAEQFCNTILMVATHATETLARSQTSILYIWRHTAARLTSQIA